MWPQTFRVKLKEDQAKIRLRTGGDLVSTADSDSEVHAERVVTLVNQSLQLSIVANNENYALAA